VSAEWVIKREPFSDQDMVEGIEEVRKVVENGQRKKVLLAATDWGQTKKNRC